MGKFYQSLSPQEIAEQVASLLNQNNYLSHVRTPEHFFQGQTNYIIETHGKLVLGACGVRRISSQLSEVKHLVVRPAWRKKGIGRFLLDKVLANLVNTPLVYATVRQNNEGSLKLFREKGFSEITSYTTGNRQVALLVRNNQIWQKKTDWKLVSPNVL